LKDSLYDFGVNRINDPFDATTAGFGVKLATVMHHFTSITEGQSSGAVAFEGLSL
jgi:hypothetical protein